MAGYPNRSGGEGLERSGAGHSPDWIRQTGALGGVALLEAWFQGPAYRRHRHDTYAIGVTESGVQAFGYRGATHVSLPGQVVVLHPDEPHDGYAGSDAGFGYRLLYVEPALIFEAVRVLSGHRQGLPFVRDPVVTNTTLAVAIRAAFQDGHEPLAMDDLVLHLATGLLAEDSSSEDAHRPRRLDVAAIERARQFLDVETTRVVRNWELETLTGLTRYDLARQFRAVVGASPYRYSLMRRLGFARAQIANGQPLAAVAFAAGFADQAHFTRQFTAAFGITPARYGALIAGEGPPRDRVPCFASGVVPNGVAPVTGNRGTTS
jgi:AraC-like DNA-binding protein